MLTNSTAIARARRLEAAARAMREQAAAPGCQHHQVGWEQLTEERRTFWRDRAAVVLAAADAAE